MWLCYATSKQFNYSNASITIVWFHDAILHSYNKIILLHECNWITLLHENNYIIVHQLFNNMTLV